VAVVFGLLGLALNAPNFGALLPLQIGRALTLPIAMLFGPWLGLVASLIATVPMIPATATGTIGAALAAFEALLIGYFSDRGRSPLIVGSVMWIVVAITIVAAPQLWRAGAALVRAGAAR